MSGSRRYYWSTVERLFKAAMRCGPPQAQRRGVGVISWDISARCENPKTVTFSAVPPEDRINQPTAWISIIPGLTKVRLTVELATRCRRCRQCLRRKAAMWRERARLETRLAVRTWFGTLTFSPRERYLLLAKASRAAARKGEDYDALNRERRFQYYANASGALVTKWLKRIRKQSGVKIRYLLVAEEHKSGDPHFHVLIHESGEPIRKAVLRAQWSHGFSKWNLVQGLQTADYVTKYVSKGLYARVRASVRYGKHVLTT